MPPRPTVTPVPSVAADPGSLAPRLRPQELIVLTRERLQATLEDAVRRGRLTRADAAELARALVDRGRRGAEELRAEVPVEGYDELTAAQVSGRLAALTPAELRQVRDYERRNANRKSVLAALEHALD